MRWRAGLTVGSAVVVAAFIVLLLRGAAWLYGPGLRRLTPDQQVTAIDDVRGRLIQLGAGLLAAGALVYTALNFRLSRESHVTDRYTKAIEQLGSERLDVRLGAIYALERIMIDSPRDHATIVEVLAAFVREHSLPAVARKGKRATAEDENRPAPAGPGTDVLAAVTVLGRRPSKRQERGRLNLRSAYANGADLAGANLNGANLTEAHLLGAQLGGADLRGANLGHANLRHADLTRADLIGAQLIRADLAGVLLLDADLTSANLASADLTLARSAGVRLDRAYLADADLRAADLTRAYLADAWLNSANLKSANLAGANLDRAQLDGANLAGAFLDGATLDGANLTNAVLPAGYAADAQPDPTSSTGSSAGTFSAA